VLVKIDNPETVAKHEQAVAAKIVADAQLANINAGTRAEVIAAKKAALERIQSAGMSPRTMRSSSRAISLESSRGQAQHLDSE
jgi:HlyD family secretion protein